MRVRKNREPGLTDFLELLGDRPPTIANLGKVPPLKLDEKSQAEITSFMNKTVGTLSLDNFRISAIVLSHAHPDIHRDNGMSTLGSALPRLAPENQQTGFEEIFKHIAPYAPVSRAPALKSLAVNVLKSPIPYSPDSLKYASGNFTKVLNAMDGMSGAEKKPILEALAGPLPFHGFTDEGWQPRFNEIVSATHGMTPEQYGHVLGVLDEQLKTIEQFFPQQKEAVDASRRAIELRRSRFDLGE